MLFVRSNNLHTVYSIKWNNLIKRRFSALTLVCFQKKMADEESEESSVNKGISFGQCLLPATQKAQEKVPVTTVSYARLIHVSVQYSAKEIKEIFMNLSTHFYHVTLLSGKIPMSLKQCCGSGSRKTKMIF
jgi:hypothetical protein